MDRLKLFSKVLSGVTALATAAISVPAAAFVAEAEDVVYGTMDIPYAQFYAAEGVAYDVDAVSSATTSKWKMNTEGGLVQGTYNQANTDDEGGQILGVTYPVAITESELESLGDDNYNFTALDTTPAAYKTVTVADGVASFSAVNGTTTNDTTDITVETFSNYGNYCITVNNLTIERGETRVAKSSNGNVLGTIYGATITDTDGNVYAMRHLENIWNNELAFSMIEGTTERHGNVVSTNGFAGLSGATIDKITYITADGYYEYDVDPDTYLPKVYEGEVTVADAAVADGSTTVTSTLPEDFIVEYSVEGLDATVTDGTLTFSEALAGSYTLLATDTSGVYASYETSFTLTTDSVPVVFDEESNSFVAADGATEEEVANYIANISSVSVNGTAYSASGKRSVKIINSDGTINFEATSNNAYVFSGSDSYEIEITSTGFSTNATATTTAGMVYGTMDIPYAQFYAGEGVAYDVDAVSSATTTKWASNGEGKLVEGTYNQANTDGDGGQILGVTYPVIISSTALAALGDDNYNFTALDETPTAYKAVTVTDGVASFSAVNGTTTEDTSDITVETFSRWGNYCLTVEGITKERGGYAKNSAGDQIGPFYGATITDTDGNVYAMRHLENIWNNELAFSVIEGTTEAHGNVVSTNGFAGLSGATIDKITYITASGYYVYDVDDTYLPKVYEGGITISNAALVLGKTPIAVNLPSDFEAEYSVEGLEVSVSGSTLTYSNALAGTYTLLAEDANGVYAPCEAEFTLVTIENPVVFDTESNKLVAADGATEEEVANYIANISSVSVNGTAYSASGKRSVTIINSDGTLNTEATSNDEAVFAESGEYTIEITASGFGDNYSFTVGVDASANTEEPADSTTVKVGDVNGDGSIDSTDAVEILIYYANTIVNSEADIDEEAADTNDDGTIDSVDAVYVLQYYASGMADSSVLSKTMQEFLSEK